MNNNLAMIKTSDLKKELAKRGCDTSSVKPAKKTWEVGFSKTYWQYFDGIEADTQEQAVAIAYSKISESEWCDYGNRVEIVKCEED